MSGYGIISSTVTKLRVSLLIVSPPLYFMTSQLTMSAYLKRWICICINMCLFVCSCVCVRVHMYYMFINICIYSYIQDDGYLAAMFFRKGGDGDENVENYYTNKYHLRVDLKVEDYKVNTYMYVHTYVYIHI
jgi:hypothetical protein